MRNLHLSLAHLIWKQHLTRPCCVIDATAGNGHDSLYLAQLLSYYEGSSLAIFDVQKQAIDTTQKRLADERLEEKVCIKFFNHSHYPFPDTFANNSVDLIVYNLGYLPGGDKSITTLAHETLPSLAQALTLLKQGGIMTVACYPGHPEGLEEMEQIFQWQSKLERDFYTVIHLKNNKPTAPQLLVIRKDLTK